jgi:hypothetical protein
LRGVSVRVFKISKYFKEATKKLIIIYGNKKLLKGLENHPRKHTESTDLNG